MFVRKEGHAQVFLGDEFFMRGDAVFGDAKDFCACGLEIREGLGKVDRFTCAASGVVTRVEKQHHRRRTQG